MAWFLFGASAYRLPELARAGDAAATPVPHEPRIEAGAPVTVVLAAPTVRGWGLYQFPGLERLADGRIRLSFHVEADSATAYGLPPARAVSADEGRTWTLSPREPAADGTAPSWQSPPLALGNGDLIWSQQQKPLDP